jgi:hypothetical protein
LLQKPFGEDSLMDTIEDKEIYSELQKLDMKTQDIKGANFRHEQLKQLIEILRKLQLYHLFDYTKKQTSRAPLFSMPNSIQENISYPKQKLQDSMLMFSMCLSSLYVDT